MGKKVKNEVKLVGWYSRLYQWFIIRVFYCRYAMIVRWFFKAKFIHPVKNKHSKLTKGYCDADIADFDLTVPRFILPRLVEFAKKQDQYQDNVDTKSYAKWIAKRDEMIYAFTILTDVDLYNKLQETAESKDVLRSVDIADAKNKLKRVSEGLKLFAKHLPEMWY